MHMPTENPLLKAITAMVVQGQTSPDEVPLTLHAGDVVRVGEPHPERSGYVWVNDAGFGAGWVPQDLLDRSGDVARAAGEYCSAELAVQPGDVVRLMWEDPRHGAWWCESRDSERGWVRSAHLQFASTDG